MPRGHRQGRRGLTPESALALLEKLGAPPRLVRHHELVVEAARIICDRLEPRFDRAAVLAGAALHDAGKILHPAELAAPGHEHEAAGEALLTRNAVPPQLARFCVTHAKWEAPGVLLEDLLVALADKLWRGKRETELEKRVLQALAEQSGRAGWEIFDSLDALCEEIAAGGSERLERSLT